MTYQDPRYRDPEYNAKWRAAHPEKVREYSQRHLSKPENREKNRARASRHYYANQEERKTQARTWYANHRDEALLTKKVSTFGLTRDEYVALVERHAGRCGVCGIEARLSVDHNHKTGRVRGLLCTQCNFMIGHGKDDSEVLRKAAVYLEATR